MNVQKRQLLFKLWHVENGYIKYMSGFRSIILTASTYNALGHIENNIALRSLQKYPYNLWLKNVL
jgi:hypothetical protein